MCIWLEVPHARRPGKGGGGGGGGSEICQHPNKASTARPGDPPGRSRRPGRPGAAAAGIAAVGQCWPTKEVGPGIAVGKTAIWAHFQTEIAQRTGEFESPSATQTLKNHDMATASRLRRCACLMWRHRASDCSSSSGGHMWHTLPEPSFLQPPRRTPSLSRQFTTFQRNSQTPLLTRPPGGPGTPYGPVRTRATLAADAEEGAPTLRQLKVLALHAALPMVGFGLMDQTIMIQAGDLIDSTIGSKLALPTLAAAACGQVGSPDVLAQDDGWCWGGLLLPRQLWPQFVHKDGQTHSLFRLSPNYMYQCACVSACFLLYA